MTVPAATHKGKTLPRLDDLLLYVLLAACVGLLWLIPLPSSFWTDEVGTAFLVRYGPAHSSFEAAPQFPGSVYFWLPRAADAVFGFSEIAYRAPSVVFMGIALLAAGRLAARLIHPEAAWFAALGCLALPYFNYQAADARPYALGTCVALLCLLFLIRWLDSASLLDAALFLVFASLLWRIHLLLWPVYMVFVLYVVVRLARGETPVGWTSAAAAFALLGLALMPVFFDVLKLLPEAEAHTIAALPTRSQLLDSLYLWFIVVCGFGAFVGGAHHVAEPTHRPSLSSWVLILGFWLVQPLGLFAYSHIAGISVFEMRYTWMAVPAAALLATAVTNLFLSMKSWKRAALLLGVALLSIPQQWREPWPNHNSENWRAAAQAVNSLVLDENTPVICISPYLEARTPTWYPNYPVPSFLYAQLAVYPISGQHYLFPGTSSQEAEGYAAALTEETLSRRTRFLLYGTVPTIREWRAWFSRRQELARWRHRVVVSFGERLEVVLFESESAAVTDSRAIALTGQEE